ncbi:hypothetical protein DRP05_08050 [Archaeoglobales archaeon]|nr:MAG: hypothetical protein DRP05_08050 [Archaeoglobales archaeon]
MNVENGNGVATRIVLGYKDYAEKLIPFKFVSLTTTSALFMLAYVAKQREHLDNIKVLKAACRLKEAADCFVERAARVKNFDKCLENLVNMGLLKKKRRTVMLPDNKSKIELYPGRGDIWYITQDIVENKLIDAKALDNRIEVVVNGIALSYAYTVFARDSFLLFLLKMAEAVSKHLTLKTMVEEEHAKTFSLLNRKREICNECFDVVEKIKPGVLAASLKYGQVKKAALAVLRSERCIYDEVREDCRKYLNRIKNSVVYKAKGEVSDLPISIGVETETYYINFPEVCLINGKVCGLSLRLALSFYMTQKTRNSADYLFDAARDAFPYGCAANGERLARELIRVLKRSILLSKRTA